MAPAAEAADDLDGNQLFGYLETITGISLRARAEGMVDYGRISGSRYDALTAAYVEQSFARFGMAQVRREPFVNPQPTWILRSSQLVLLDGPGGHETAFPSAFTSHQSRVTGPQGIEAEIVDIGEGSPEEIGGRSLDGKIALVHAYARGIVFNHSGQKVASRLAAEGRVLGIVLAIHQPGDPDTRYALIPGSLAIDGGRGPDRLYWTNVSGADGDRLATAIRSAGDTPTRVCLTVEGEMESGQESSNTFGVVPGRTDQTILVIAHTDSHFQGATDNASGVAILLGLARHFAALPAGSLERTLVFVATGGHHNGPSGGVRDLIARHGDLVGRTVLVVNVEHLGSRPPDGRGGIGPAAGVTTLHVPAKNPAIITAMRAAAARHGLELRPEVIAFWTADYYPFLATGTPAVMLMQPTFWYHTEADTLDKISPDGLASAARTLADFITAMDRTPAATIAEGEPTRGLLRDQPPRP